MRTLTRPKILGIRTMAITLIAGLAVVLAVAPPARADIAGTDVVTTCNGSGPGSLSAAVQNAAPGDTITFSVTCPPSSPIILTSTINITADLTIDGPGPSALAVSGNNTVQVFDIASGVVVLSGLTVEDGLAGSDIVGGGGILNNSSLTISDSTVSNNASTGSGGGIFNGWSGRLSVTDSTVSDNVSSWGDGGGIGNDGGIVAVSDSELSGNWAQGAGGGIANESATDAADGGGNLAVSDSTLTSNSADWGGGLSNAFFSSATVTHATVVDNAAWSAGGGIYTSVSVTVNASIVATNTISNPYNTQEWANCSLNGSTLVGSFDFDDQGSCGFTGLNVPIGSTAGLDPAGLQANGGPTLTVGLEPASVLIRVVDSTSLCSTSDQRGVARPTPCDVGAYEYAVTDVSQTVAFTSTPSNAFVGGVYDAIAKTSSGLPVTLVTIPSFICTVSGSEVTFISVGTCNLLAEQPGTASYAAAPLVRQLISVTPERAIISSDEVSATTGSFFRFNVATTGTPLRSLTEGGRLPKGIGFRYQGKGIATLSGIPTKAGVFHLTIEAIFGRGITKDVVTQACTLIVTASDSSAEGRHRVLLR